MKVSNLNAIHQSFGIQAQGFESPAMNFSKKEYLDHTVAGMALCSTDAVLEVAAGTCACGRACAPFVQTMTCLDVTPAMLEVGKKAAQEQHLNNMVFVRGNAEALPFLDESFDVVFSRLAFHHFPDIHRPFEEMARVLKPGGKLVLIDMEAAEESLRATEDWLEALRDPSHVRNLSRTELTALFAGQSFSIEHYEMTEIPVSLQSWMELTKTPASIQEEIRTAMEAEINGARKTGFFPYVEGSEIFFRQRWIMVLGRKRP